MPWSTPTLRQVRSLVRDNVNAILPGADAAVPNSVLRVVSDVTGATCHLTLQYVDWLALQLLPDTAESIWLDRHANIWLVNDDGSIGRKVATLASGIVNMSGNIWAVIPAGTSLNVGSVYYETTQQVTVTSGSAPVPVPTRAIDPGAAGNLDPGATMGVNAAVGIDPTATVVTMQGGTDTETDEELRSRVLLRIREPPMGGDATDYVEWALAVPGVTRAWPFPQEMGIGTMTLRFMMDDLRAGNGGFPLPDDVDAVAAYINKVRPVTVKDMFVVCPIPYPVNARIAYLDADNHAVHDAIVTSLLNQFLVRSKPGQTWYRAWLDEAIMSAPGVNAYDLIASDVAMPSSGYMPVLGDVTYG
jgi:uncharacterized phage protein gp47/JayE